jgi:signal transduction histidine kinase
MSNPETISRDDFEAIIGFTVHDAKNALGLMLHTVESLGKELASDPRQRPRIASLQYELARVNGALIRLLALHRMRHQQLALNLNGHSLLELFEDLEARILPLAELREMRLTLDCQEALHGVFDDELIVAVLQHALFGALRYGRSHILMRAWTQEKQLHIQVSDDGPGFGERQFAVIGQSPERLRPSSGDTGLGLYFSSRIAAMHRHGERCGAVHLNNGGELGGAVFELVLPQ